MGLPASMLSITFSRIGAVSDLRVASVGSPALFMWYLPLVFQNGGPAIVLLKVCIFHVKTMPLLTVDSFLGVPRIVRG